ncbi:solute carrier family 12 member 9-like isoform X2 [Bolinopsis microptera]|uniref:solute carrier family 12 member 9-like isoform X2 n=1 Tax=Bolinopsis microptera TaxID=2820187 RepID=UPI00307B0D1B
MSEEKESLLRASIQNLSKSVQRYGVESGLGPGAAADSRKTLGTFSGVFVPCTLSMFSAILFLRMGYIVGYGGVIDTLIMFTLSFFIVMMTILSVCAISTNGAIEGGGAYFMISRSIGPEFGGAMGIIFFFAQIFGSTVYLLGLVDAIVDSFGEDGGNFGKFLPEHGHWKNLYGSCILLIMLFVVLIGAEMFAKTNLVIFAIVAVTLVINIVNFIIQKPINDLHPPSDNSMLNHTVNLTYTSWSRETFLENRAQNYTIDYTTKRTTSFETVFAVLFTGFTGVFAGSNMSGDLKNASKSIPFGTVLSCIVSYFIYIMLSLAIAFTCSRTLIQNDYLFLEHICKVPGITTVGTFSVTFSASLGAFIGASRILEALALDDILGSLLSVVKKGRSRRGNPWVAVVVSWVFLQALLFVGSLNLIAPFVATFSLLTYATVNMACLALDLAGAPNFRPTFVYFNKYTSLVGFVSSIVMAFVVNPVYASTSFGISVMLFVFIMFRTPGSSWGYISQALIFHQVRKYLLMLDTRKDHVKFWRPSILFLCKNPRTCIPSISFLNDMKKGGLYVIGTNIVGDLREPGFVSKLEDQNMAWLSLVQVLGVKAFVETTVDRDVRNGIQNLIMTAGLGGMTPNTVVIGFYDTSESKDFVSEPDGLPCKKPLFSKLRRNQSDSRGHIDKLPEIETHTNNSRITVDSYIGVIKDVMALRKNLCILRHFDKLKRPSASSSALFIDVWPVPPHPAQTHIEDDTTSMFLLQLSCILHMVGSWGGTRLRVMAISPSQTMGATERVQLEGILKILRIEAHVQTVIQPEDYETLPEVQKYQSLNQTVRENSQNTVVTFMYLPRPPQSEDRNLDYLEKLTILSEDLPPTLLVSGLSKVTTTEL